MKYFYSLTLIAGLCLLLTACDSSTTRPEDQHTAHKGIVLNKLEVGQQSRYVRFIGGSFLRPQEASFEYRADTLIVEVVEKREDGYVLREKYSEGSESWYNGGQPVVIPAVDILASVEGDTVRFSVLDESNNGPSHLFSTSRDLEILLSIQSAREMVMEEWWPKMENPIDSVYGYLPEFRLLERNYRNLAVYVDNSGMIVDGPGFTYLYSGSVGVVRTFMVNPWLAQGTGWDLLP